MPYQRRLFFALFRSTMFIDYLQIKTYNYKRTE